MGIPRWSDDPTHILGVLANYLRLEDPDLAPDTQFTRGARAAEAAATGVVRRVRRHSRLRAAAVRIALGRVRELAGTPASAGTVTAIARVVLDPIGAHLEPGEILVAPSTDPGWTPLFLTAAGLVMEMGGANSHGTVIAREYGIPAVVGVPDATLHITTGQQITIHGTTGLIEWR